MGFQVRRPATTVLTLAGGVTLTVRRHLTAGEARAIFRRMYTAGVTGEAVLDPMMVGTSKILGYLLDWSGVLGPDGAPIAIRDEPSEVLTAALDAIDPEDYSVILKAIEAHDDAMQEARAAEKNARDGERTASAISPSPFAVAGASSGSGH